MSKTFDPEAQSGLTIPLWQVLWFMDEAKERALRRLMPARMRVPYSWPLLPQYSPCDLHFCDYVEERKIRRQSIFHFGTGLHHIVGLRNRGAGWENEILGITASPREHASYVRRVVRDPSVGEHYKVLFADIYSLGPASLPTFDMVTLFHLCEFTPRSTEQGGQAGTADSAVLSLFHSKLAPGGRIVFFENSDGYPRTTLLLGTEVAEGRLVLEERYKTLLVYRSA